MEEEEDYTMQITNSCYFQAIVIVLFIAVIIYLICIAL